MEENAQTALVFNQYPFLNLTVMRVYSAIKLVCQTYDSAGVVHSILRRERFFLGYITVRRASPSKNRGDKCCPARLPETGLIVHRRSESRSRRTPPGSARRWTRIAVNIQGRLARLPPAPGRPSLVESPLHWRRPRRCSRRRRGATIRAGTACTHSDSPLLPSSGISGSQCTSPASHGGWPAMPSATTASPAGTETTRETGKAQRGAGSKESGLCSALPG